MLALPLMVFSVALLSQAHGDIRGGGFPWIIASVAALLLICLNGLRIQFNYNANILLRIGIWLTIAGLAGMLVLFGGIGVGSLFNLNEPQGILGYVVTGVGVLAIVGLPLGLLSLGIAVIHEGLLPVWSRIIPLFLAVLLPAAFIAVGLTDDATENIVITAWLLLFGLGWSALGFSVLRSG
jgi:hypothetical protein